MSGEGPATGPDPPDRDAAARPPPLPPRRLQPPGRGATSRIPSAGRGGGGRAPAGRAPAGSGSGSPPAGPGKLRDAALVLPVLGAFLLIPPFPEIFAAPVRLAGVPLIVLYIFGVWLALIVGALCLARPLRRLEPPPDELDMRPGEPAPRPAEPARD